MLRKNSALRGSSCSLTTLTMPVGESVPSSSVSTRLPMGVGGFGVGRDLRRSSTSTGRGSEPMISRISLMTWNLVRAFEPPVAGETSSFSLLIRSEMVSMWVLMSMPSTSRASASSRSSLVRVVVVAAGVGVESVSCTGTSTPSSSSASELSEEELAIAGSEEASDDESSPPSR